MKLRVALFTLLLAAGTASAAAAFPIALPGTEGFTVIVNGNSSIVATYQGNSAAYSNDLYLMLLSNGLPGDDGNTANDLFIFNNHTSLVGSTVDLGTFLIGTELEFRLHVNNTGYDYFTGPASRNPDQHFHARVDSSFGPNETLVSFEDLYNGPFDYNDLSFSFTNTNSAPATAPEPASMVLVGTALAGWVARRRMR
ncbi:MAG TPA: PEP-CTERM sorting domain-containing protein [Vicinamibacterales bacterium]|nr:PEP-CTERM sorting domain-containing protein [Vicinamibacterales bacterium]